MALQNQKKEVDMVNALKLVSDGVVENFKRTSYPACLVLDSSGRFWLKNKHWTAEELAKELANG